MWLIVFRVSSAAVVLVQYYRFTISFRAALKVWSAGSPEDACTMDVGDYRILLVDNNVNDAKIIKRYLQRHSEAIIVDYAPDADRCYRKLIEHVYDLLLIDCNLPDGDCAEMVKEPPLVTRAEEMMGPHFHSANSG